jgi:ATP-dependent DNA helicase RecG
MTKQNLFDFLQSSLTTLKGVGPATKLNLERLINKDRIFNLLLHRPNHVENIAIQPRLFEVSEGKLIAIKLKIESHKAPETGRQPYRIMGYTPSGYVNLVFFKIFPPQLQKLAIGKEVLILGRLQKSFGENQIIHPQEIFDINTDKEKIEKLPSLDISYPLTHGVTQKFLQQKIKEIFSRISPDNFYEEWINPKLLESRNWQGFAVCLQKIHHPQNESDLLPQNIYRTRLAYDELLAWQLAILLVRKQETQTKKVPVNIKKAANLADKFLQEMPFKPTTAQLQAAIEIKQDMLSSKKMLRLLQGDVGSGKTVLAIYSCLLAIAQNKQACVIVPIAILADQHFEYFKKLAEVQFIKPDSVAILTGKTKKSQRKKILQELAEGKISILISTHAALQEDVKFKNLGLAVIDEQHRFGVMQRLSLVRKGLDVDVLLMSATPIPRSLMMAMYSDMDISILAEKPTGRKEIQTLVMSQNKQEEIFAAVKRALKNQEKIYWICPAIEENEALQPNGENSDVVENKLNQEENFLTRAEEKYKELRAVFGNKVALIHGKMKEGKKDEIMQNFKQSQEIQILVTTTVIEVGIDVKDATIIIIENAENFGLSQLHQLRGRVGRGLKQSYCILLYGKKYGAKARERLLVLRESNDGFFIAEEDLKMRGSGELLGTKQSGVPEFKIADFAYDLDLIKIAHKQVQMVLEDDKELSKTQNEKYRILLKLFDYSDCLTRLGGG